MLRRLLRRIECGVVLSAAGGNPDVVTEYHTDVAYVTNVVTVTEGGSAPTTAVAAADAAPTYDPGNHWGGKGKGGNGGWHWPHKNKSKKTKTKTRTQPPPPPSTPTSTYEQPAPAPQPTQEPEPEPSQGAPSGLTSYNDIVVAHHNVHRANHSSPDVQWDAGLAATAQKIANSCVYAHDVDMDGGGYGQNIAAGVEKGNVSAVITDLFYNGEIGYFMGEFGKPQPSMTDFELWGHFTQIVWKETNKVGCATQYCPNGLGNVGSNVSPYFTVCNYSPPGNYANEYKDNVAQPDGEPTVQWNYGM